MRNMLFKYILILLCLFGSSLHLRGQITAEQRASIDQLLVGREASDPGFVIGILHENELVYEKSCGVEELESKTRISTETRFPVASMGKQFIAAAIGLLVLENKLGLEDEISAYLPELDNFSQGIKVKHLIHQTSGIKDYPNLMIFRGDAYDDLIPLEEGIQLLSKLQGLNFEPGDQFSYSNSNYLLLSEIISRVSKMDFRDFINKRIFNVLGMNNSGFLIPINGENQMLALDYRKGAEGRYIPSEQVIAAQDQIYSTIKDLSLWDRNFYTHDLGGKVLQDLLLRKGRLSDEEEINYGFGLFLDDYRGLRTVSHAGDMGGYHSQFLQFPGEKISVIVLTNAADFNAYRISHQIADILLKDQLADQPALAESPIIELPKKKLKQYCGAYWNAGINRPRIIYLRGGTLQYNRPDNYESSLVPVGKNRFRVLNAVQKQIATIEFVGDGDNIAELIFTSSKGKKTSMKKYVYPAYKAKDLMDFAGTYFCQELETTYRLWGDKTKISIDLKGQTVSRMVAINADYFKDGYLGDFKFVRDKNQQLTGFYLSTKSKRATNMYFEKTE